MPDLTQPVYLVQEGGGGQAAPPWSDPPPPPPVVFDLLWDKLVLEECK